MELEINWPRPYIILPILVIVFIVGVGLILYGSTVESVETITIETIEPVETVTIETIESKMHDRLPKNLSELEQWSPDDIWTLYNDTLNCFRVEKYHASYVKCRKIIKIFVKRRKQNPDPDPANTELLDQIGE